MSRRFGSRGACVNLDGERLDIRAHIETVSGYSAHADQQNLIDFIRRMRHPPRHVRLVHGERDAQLAFKARIEQWASEAGKQVEVSQGADYQAE